MNIAVCIKQVPDTETKVKISGDNKWIEEGEINFILNPYDEFAVEESLKLVEANGGEVTIISLGPDKWQYLIIGCGVGIVNGQKTTIFI